MEIASETMRPADGSDVLTTVGQKYTNVPLLPSLLVALAGGSASIALAYLLKGIVPYFYSLILERGPMQFLTVYAFWFTTGMLVFKYRSLQKERNAFGLDFIKSFTVGREMVGTKTFVGEQQMIAENLDPRHKDLILVSRINKAIKQIRINKNPADVAHVLTTVAETDAAVMDSSYILIKYMIWALPVLGFIGTIMGMTQAIGSFDTVLKGISEVGFAGVKQSLGLVTSGLSVAFETTFLALVLSAIVNLFANALQKREEDNLSDVEEFTTDNIINKYTVLRDQITSSHQMVVTPEPEKEPGVDPEGMVRELKNMNKQQQINADELMAQVGRVIEAVEALPQPAGGGAAQPEGGGQDLKQVLQEMSEIIKGQAEFIKEMSSITAFVKKNMEVMEKMPATMDEMSKTSKKLGELFAQIYNRSFS